MPSNDDRWWLWQMLTDHVPSLGILMLFALCFMALNQRGEPVQKDSSLDPTHLTAERGMTGKNTAVGWLSLSQDGQFLDAVQGHVLWRRHDAHTGRELSFHKLSESGLQQTRLCNSTMRFATLNSRMRLHISTADETIWEAPLPGKAADETIVGYSFSRVDEFLAVVSNRGSLWKLTFPGLREISAEHFQLGEKLEYVAVSPTGRQIALVNDARSILIWDLATASVILRLSAAGAGCRLVAWSGDGKRLLSFGFEAGIDLWDVETGELIRRFETVSHSVQAAQLSSDGRIAVVSDDKHVGIWDVETGELQFYLKGHSGQVSALCLSDDDRTLFSSDFHGEIRRWSLTDQRLIWSAF